MSWESVGNALKKFLVPIIFAIFVIGIVIIPKKDQAVKITGHMAPETPEGQKKITAIAKMLEARKVIFQTAEDIVSFVKRQEKVFSDHSQDYWEKKAIKDGLVQAYKDVDKKWGKFIRSEAKKYGVNPKQVIAIICKESAGDQDAYNLDSKTGAWGLMGIILSTAQAYQPGITSEDLLDPELNIHIGVQRLADAKKAMKSDPGAIFAYHWGETGGQDKILAYGKSPEESDDWRFVQAIIKVSEG